MPIDALAAYPSTQRPGTFASEMDSHIGSMPAFITQANALEVAADEAASTASAAAIAAAASAVTASGYAAAAAASVATVGTAWVSGTTYAVGDCRYSPITFGSYRRKTVGAGSTDPSLDTTNWAPAVIVQAPGLVLLATLTPTAAANLDFLNVFTADYDNYLVIGDGLLPSVSDGMYLRFAVAGAVDSSASYMSSSAEADGVVTAVLTSTYVGFTTLASGKGNNFQITIANANSASTFKTMAGKSQTHVSAAPTVRHTGVACSYLGTTAITGFRLYWGDVAANFVATGKVRVYGYSNT